MCNAWNHHSECNCGWGGGSYDGYGYGSCKNLLSPRLRDKVAHNKSDNSEDNAKTFPTSCPECGDRVYYHTNGYGDSVYFDNLGYPWKVHGCFKNYWENEKVSKSLWSFEDASNLRRNFFEIDTTQQKRLIIIGAVRQIPNVIVGQFLIYKATENALASQMGIPLEKLRKIYGSLYIQETSGIKIFTEEELKQKQEVPNKAQLLRGSEATAKKSQKQSLGISINQNLNRQRSSPVNPAKPNQLIICPYCQGYIRSDRLKKHINKKCKACRNPT